MDKDYSPGAGMAACAILLAVMRSNLLTQDQVRSVLAAARSTLDEWGEAQVFNTARDVLEEMGKAV
jgi:hypothetical protein